MHKRCALVLLTLCALAMTACGGNSTSASDAAVTVNGQDVSTADYNQAVYQKRIETQDAEGYDPCNVKDLAGACTLLKREALQTLIDRQLVREYAGQHGISVSKADVDREWAVVFKNRFDGRQDVLAAFSRRMHTTPAAIRQGVADDLLQSQVVYAVTKNMSMITPAVRLAVIRVGSPKELRKVKADLKRGTQFLFEAYQLTRVPGAQCAQQGTQCGELGWTPNAFIPGTERGLLVDRPGSIVGPYGVGQEQDIYLIQARTSRYQMSNRQAFTMRTQVLFPRWLKNQQKKAKITKHVEV